MMQSQEFQVALNCLKIEIREFLVGLYAREIKQIFEHSGYLKTPYDGDHSSKRDLVDSLYLANNWEEESTILEFFKIIQTILQTYTVPAESKEYVTSTCKKLGFSVSENDFCISHPILSQNSRFFNLEFPAGLPFGKFKPELAIKASEDRQQISFEWKEGLAILENDVYPNLSYRLLAEKFGCDEENSVFANALINMNQTSLEKDFFIRFGKNFKIRHSNVPVLIPQAWIQWHSLSKRRLGNFSTLKSNDIYRVDFVAFWNNKKTAIFIDDISHYAEREEDSDKWLASQKRYSETLCENRWLLRNGWKVFRASNLEVKDSNKLDSILEDLRFLMEF